MNTICPGCGSTLTKYDSVFDYWECKYCGEFWSDGENDPDYDDESLEALETIADRNIELIHQHLP